VLLALCLAGGVTALWCLDRSIDELTSLAESHRIQVMRANLSSSAVRIETDLMAFAAGRSKDDIRQRESVQRFCEAVEQCNSCHHEPKVQARLDEVHETLHEYEQAVDHLIESIGGSDIEDTRMRERDTNMLADRLTRQATEMSDQARDHVSMRGADATGSVRTAWITLVGTLVAVLVVGGFVARHLQRRMTGPVDDLLHGIKQVRHGQRGHRFAIDGDEEFRSLGAAFNEAYESMATAQEGVLQAERLAAVGKLAAGIAHEVGNPLASISAVVQMMQRRAMDETQKEHAGVILQHVDRASQIVRELLAFSRPAREDRLEPVNVSALLDKAVSLLKYDKRLKGLDVERQYDANLQMQQGNSNRLLLVFTNVLINALDALGAERDGDRRLAVAAEQNHDQVVIRFEDNGPGMTPEQVASAFEPFYTTKDPGAGTGLGLWVAYRIVERHHGTIRIDSEPRRGTTVIVELPSGTHARKSTPN
jgi:signal transduction histidine kinase